MITSGFSLAFNDKNLLENSKKMLWQRNIYQVTTSTDGHGSITASPMSGFSDTTVSLSNTPNPNYSFTGYSVTGATLTGNQFTLNNDVTAMANFSALPITRKLGDNINPFYVEYYNDSTCKPYPGNTYFYFGAYYTEGMNNAQVTYTAILDSQTLTLYPAPYYSSGTFLREHNNIYNWNVKNDVSAGSCLTLKPGQSALIDYVYARFNTVYTTQPVYTAYRRWVLNDIMCTEGDPSSGIWRLNDPIVLTGITPSLRLKNIATTTASNSWTATATLYKIEWSGRLLE